MPRTNETDEVLEIYFQKNGRKKINIVSRETGISPSTISRYARRHGYLNYAEFLNEKLLLEEKFEDLYELIKGKKVYIASSRSCDYIGRYFFHKLVDYNYEAFHLNKHNQEDSSKGVALFFSLSDSSRSMEGFKKDHKNAWFISPFEWGEQRKITPNIKTYGRLGDGKYKTLHSFYEWVRKQKI